jgi:hypothetical protein
MWAWQDGPFLLNQPEDLICQRGSQSHRALGPYGFFRHLSKPNVPSSSAIPSNLIHASEHHCQKIGLYEALKEKLLYPDPD